MKEIMNFDEVTVHLSGVILRKAEMHDFTSVYTKVIEKIAQMEVFGGDEFLEILGEVGG
jgi:hypothetical protein